MVGFCIENKPIHFAGYKMTQIYSIILNKFSLRKATFDSKSRERILRICIGLILKILDLTLFFKYLNVFLLSTVKFFFSVPSAFALGLDFTHTLIFTLSGGVFGIIAFFYLSEWLLKIYHHYKSTILEKLAALGIIHHSFKDHRKRKRKIFSKRSRKIVKLARKYGLWGIVVLTPILLSIPIGAFLASRYFLHKKFILLYLIVSVICWGIILVSITSMVVSNSLELPIIHLVKPNNI